MDNSNNNKAQSKRGLAYQQDAHKADNKLLFSPESPVAWYYTWSLWPAPEVNDTSAVEFLPLVHSTDDVAKDDFRKQLDGLPPSSTHLLTFNEPDGDTGSGGSAVEPEDAAKAYIDRIAPLRSGDDGDGRTWNISHPSVTGSPRGLDWLRRFNESCWDLDRDKGCPADFVAVHWYGAYQGLAGWLDTLRDFYKKTPSSSSSELKFWITEMALPQQDDEATLRMMNETLPYLDGLGYVDGYAWFGAFRKGEKANAWTGDAVSLFDDEGGLTELGSLYLSPGSRSDGKNGDSSGGGFEPGTKGPPGNDGDEEGAAASLPVVSRWAIGLAGVLAVGLVVW
ncbi:uncharacterized protein PG986_000952 [Apiospora aurea]|uniref:Asl1-like glycosyl hydrolase catalytic domain-containing protein n=1 Tax=Apiospora aurea TaxID=335848 RepID=A0ABR1QX67_9PEZI